MSGWWGRVRRVLGLEQPREQVTDGMPPVAVDDLPTASERERARAYARDLRRWLESGEDASSAPRWEDYGLLPVDGMLLRVRIVGAYYRGERAS